MKRGLFCLRIIASAIIATTAAAPFLFFVPAAQADFDCLTLTSNATSDQRQYCQNQVTQLEAQLQTLNAQLQQQKSQSGTLSGDIKILTTQIAEKTTEIKAKSLIISQLGESIGEKQTAIVSLAQEIQNQKDSLGQLLRKTHEMDKLTLSDFLFSSGTLSDFYSDVSRFAALKSKVKSSVDTIQTIKGVTEQKQADLQKQQDQTVDEQQALVSVQQGIKQDQATQKQLLSISKNKETEYQTVIEQQQAKVAQIKAKLFQLAGGGKAIPFSDALAYAYTAQTATGIDPAFLLAEITEESNLGSNVGKCYLTNESTGAGINATTGKTYSNVMKPSRDVQPFLAITAALGFDPLKTVVSCPIAGAGGYGGAMGPAQFIPSTWELFEDRLTAALNEPTPNPWLPQDAFMAASLYLTDLGATGSSASAQLRASCKYYGTGGSTCSYGRSVQALKLSIQSNIDYLNQYGVSKN